MLNGINLADETTGVYALRTTSGARYTINLDERTLTRHVDNGDEETAELRRDGDTVDLLRVVIARVGYGAVFVIDLNVDDVVGTVRETTPVLSIEKLA